MFDHSNSVQNIDVRSLHEPALGHELDRPALDVVRDFSSPYGDRLTPLDVHEARLGRRRALPDDTMVFKSPDDLKLDVVIHCPLTGVPFTEHMAKAVYLDHGKLQAMVDRRVPLGVSESQWELAQSSIYSTLQDAGLYDPNETIVKAGGSSVAGFSSRATALKKKEFPQSAEALQSKIEENGVRFSHYRERIEIRAMRAMHLWDSFAPAERPKAPWWGIMHRLKLETAPDVDVQIWSPEIDRRIEEHSVLSGYADTMRAKDKWARWDNDAVFTVAPELEDLQHQLDHEGIRVDLEFLAGREGAERMRARSDWWTVAPPR